MHKLFLLMLAVISVDATGKQGKGLLKSETNSDRSKHEKRKERKKLKKRQSKENNQFDESLREESSGQASDGEIITEKNKDQEQSNGDNQAENMHLNKEGHEANLTAAAAETKIDEPQDNNKEAIQKDLADGLQVLGADESKVGEDFKPEERQISEEQKAPKEELKKDKDNLDGSASVLGKHSTDQADSIPDNNQLAHANASQFSIPVDPLKTGALEAPKEDGNANLDVSASGLENPSTVAANLAAVNNQSVDANAPQIINTDPIIGGADNTQVPAKGPAQDKSKDQTPSETSPEKESPQSSSQKSVDSRDDSSERASPKKPTTVVDLLETYKTYFESKGLSLDIYEKGWIKEITKGGSDEEFYVGFLLTSLKSSKYDAHRSTINSLIQDIENLYKNP